MKKKTEQAPAAKGTSPKQVGSREGKGKKTHWQAEACLKQIPQDEKGPILEPGCIPQVHRP